MKDENLTGVDFRDVVSECYNVFAEYIEAKLKGIRLYHKPGESEEIYKSIENNKVTVELWRLFEDRVRQAIASDDEDEVTICLEDMEVNLTYIKVMANNGCELAKELVDKNSQLIAVYKALKTDGHKVFDKNTLKLLGVSDLSDRECRVVRFAV